VLVIMGACMLSAALLGAQDAGPAPAQGFSAQTLVSQLSLYLPEESTRNMNAGAAGRSGGARAGSAPGAGNGQGAQAGGRGFAPVQFTRDPKLFLTRDQITRLLPVLTALKDNPLPSPSAARKVEAEVAAILTDAQKAEYADYSAQMQKAMEQLRQRMSASAGSATGSTAGAGGATGAGGQGEAVPAGAQQRAAGGALLTTLQRRQRQLEAFIVVLKDRVKQLNG